MPEEIKKLVEDAGRLYGLQESSGERSWTYQMLIDGHKVGAQFMWDLCAKEPNDYVNVLFEKENLWQELTKIKLDNSQLRADLSLAIEALENVSRCTMVIESDYILGDRFVHAGNCQRCDVLAKLKKETV